MNKSVQSLQSVFAKVQGQAMANEGIFEGDYLVVDRSINPIPNSLVMAVMSDGEIALKRLRDIKPEQIWGVVTSVIRKV